MGRRVGVEFFTTDEQRFFAVMGRALKSVQDFKAAANDTSGSPFSGIMRGLSATENQFNRSTRAINRNVQQTNNSLTTLARTSSSLGGTLGNAFSSLGVLSGGALGLGALTTGLVSVVRTTADFEQSIANVGSIAGATEEQIAALTEAAREQGATTAFTASEAAGGLRFLSQAGFDVQQSIQALPATLSLAASGGLGLAEAADISSNVFTGFGETADQLTGIVDTLAFTASNSNTDVQQLGQAFSFVAADADAFGTSVEDTAALLGLLSNAGIQATRAGTGLRRILARLKAPTDAGAEALEQLGVSVFDAAGNARNIIDILSDLESGLNGLTQEQQAIALQDIFDIQGATAVQAILGQGIENVRQFANETNNIEVGFATDVAEQRLDTLIGDLRILQSTIQDVTISIGSGLTPALREAVQAATDFVRNTSDEFSTLISGFEQLSERAGQLGGNTEIDPPAFLDVDPTAAFDLSSEGIVRDAGNIILSLQEIQEAVGLTELTFNDFAPQIQSNIDADSFIDTEGLTQAAQQVLTLIDQYNQAVSSGAERNQEYEQQLTNLAEAFTDLEVTGDGFIGQFVRSEDAINSVLTEVQNATSEFENLNTSLSSDIYQSVATDFGELSTQSQFAASSLSITSAEAIAASDSLFTLSNANDISAASAQSAISGYDQQAVAIAGLAGEARAAIGDLNALSAAAIPGQISSNFSSLRTTGIAAIDTLGSDRALELTNVAFSRLESSTELLTRQFEKGQLTQDEYDFAIAESGQLAKTTITDEVTAVREREAQAKRSASEVQRTQEAAAKEAQRAFEQAARETEREFRSLLGGIEGLPGFGGLSGEDELTPIFNELGVRLNAFDEPLRRFRDSILNGTVRDDIDLDAQLQAIADTIGVSLEQLQALDPQSLVSLADGLAQSGELAANAENIGLFFDESAIDAQVQRQQRAQEGLANLQLVAADAIAQSLGTTSPFAETITTGTTGVSQLGEQAAQAATRLSELQAPVVTESIESSTQTLETNVESLSSTIQNASSLLSVPETEQAIPDFAEAQESFSTAIDFVVSGLNAFGEVLAVDTGTGEVDPANPLTDQQPLFRDSVTSILESLGTLSTGLQEIVFGVGGEETGGFGETDLTSAQDDLFEEITVQFLEPLRAAQAEFAAAERSALQSRLAEEVGLRAPLNQVLGESTQSLSSWSELLDESGEILEEVSETLEEFNNTLESTFDSLTEFSNELNASIPFIIGVRESLGALGDGLAEFAGGLDTLQTAFEELAGVVGGIPGVGEEPAPAEPQQQLRFGTDASQSGLALVGETGPELVVLPSQARVFPTPETRRIFEVANAAPNVTTIPTREVFNNSESTFRDSTNNISLIQGISDLSPTIRIDEDTGQERFITNQRLGDIISNSQQFQNILGQQELSIPGNTIVQSTAITNVDNRRVDNSTTNVSNNTANNLTVPITSNNNVSSIESEVARSAARFR